MLQEGIATQLTEAKAQASKDSVDEFLHGQPTDLAELLAIWGFGEEDEVFQ